MGQTERGIFVSIVKQYGFETPAQAIDKKMPVIWNTENPNRVKKTIYIMLEAKSHFLLQKNLKSPGDTCAAQ